jgi:hypothetical protein
MSLEEEVELVAYIYDLLENQDQEVRIIESGDPYDSPVIVLEYNGNPYCIAIEQFPPRENQFSESG